MLKYYRRANFGSTNGEEADLNTATMTRVALMAAVTAVAAQITIPLPFSPVPFTLQVLAVILTGLLLGPRHGALAMAIYVLIGAIGIPVFAGFRGGLGVVLGPTGGYLLAYPVAAAIAGFAAHALRNLPRGRATVTGFLFGTLGLAVIYALGAGWLSVVADLPIGAAVLQGVAPFVVLDAIKVLVATLAAVAAAPAIAPSRA
jgi:biotin transport system substrate-specific component